MGVKAQWIPRLIAGALLAGGCSAGSLTGDAGTGDAGTGDAGPNTPDLGTGVPDLGPDDGTRCVADVIHYLVRTRNVASPVPDPIGITFDGQMLWILGWGYNDTVSRLVRFDPDQVIVDRSFSFDNLMETAGAGVGGITWDGTSLWGSVAGSRNKLVQIDPATGQITRTMSSPTELGPTDLDFFGGMLWLSSGTGTIFRLNPVNGGIDRMLPTPSVFVGRDNGVAVRDGEIWVGALFGGMCVVDPATGTPLAAAVHEDGTPFIQDDVGSSVFIGDQLVMVSKRGVSYYDIR